MSSVIPAKHIPSCGVYYAPYSPFGAPKSKYRTKIASTVSAYRIYVLCVIVAFVYNYMLSLCAVLYAENVKIACNSMFSFCVYVSER